MKIVQMCSFSFSLSKSRFLCPFIVVLGGMKHRPATPWHVTSQIIWIGGCFIVATTYFLSKCLPNGCLMLMWRDTNCCMVHSSKTTFFNSAKSPMAMTSGNIQAFFFSFFITGVRCLFCAGLWDFSPNSLMRRLETVLELIAVHFYA